MKNYYSRSIFAALFILSSLGLASCARFGSKTELMDEAALQQAGCFAVDNIMVTYSEKFLGSITHPELLVNTEMGEFAKSYGELAKSTFLSELEAMGLTNILIPGKKLDVKLVFSRFTPDAFSPKAQSGANNSCQGRATVLLELEKPGNHGANCNAVITFYGVDLSNPALMVRHSTKWGKGNSLTPVLRNNVPEAVRRAMGKAADVFIKS